MRSLSLALLTALAFTTASANTGQTIEPFSKLASETFIGGASTTTIEFPKETIIKEPKTTEIELPNKTIIIDPTKTTVIKAAKAAETAAIDVDSSSSGAMAKGIPVVGALVGVGVVAGLLA